MGFTFKPDLKWQKVKWTKLMASRFDLIHDLKAL